MPEMFVYPAAAMPAFCASTSRSAVVVVTGATVIAGAVVPARSIASCAVRTIPATTSAATNAGNHGTDALRW